ncbi:MAG: hypothetical protein IJI98_11110 [Methanosphaera sp.]|nr:hypothetical protein [Methanobrevibacter sp.]MBQ6631578.1 hypothetical protein [Romboutsia sp.]MBQ6754213.1 hypothetical protein [Bacteroidales bacterium]MBR0351343.1 hypothetical protein [Clostridia bacterium]MBR0473228.1 hypothetical protein [Methanosphaera sp.]
MNIQAIDKWLDNEYGVSYTKLEELHDFVVEQDLKHREEKDKEIERLNYIINGIDEILKEHINECRVELNMIMKSDDLDYVNECSREFDVIRKNIEMIIEKIEELKGSDKE